ncbi:MAG: M20 family metallopeptidase [Acidobacteriota bacterium]|nr:MAG: M20 family metallopeptidase [Acidobacteriota bacterium]
MDPKELPPHFENKLDEITSSIRDIVEIESPSFGPDGINEVVDWIVSRAKEAIPDIEIERIAAEGRGEHLVIRAFGDLPGKPLFILGHTDTVHPTGSKEKNPTRIEDGNLYGCGTFDMKANIALMLEVFKSMKALGLRPARPVTILLACDEEVGSETGRPLVEREAANADYCFVFEPSAKGRIKTGRKGTSGYTLRARGIPAHAGLDPEKGASAVLELSKQIIAVSELNDPEAGTTVTVGTVKGGTTMNVVPEHAECTIDVRFTSLERAEKIEAALRGLSSDDERVELMLEGEINRPPMERTDAVIRLFEKAKGLAASFGYEIGETQVGGASDGNFVGALGVPVLDGLGIEGDGAHRLDEHVVVADIPKRASLLTLLLTNDLSEA